MIESASSAVRSLPNVRQASCTFQSDARLANASAPPTALIATDPPYFAQIGYADLSDYFYIWLRRALSEVHPELFATVASPKTDELIAAPFRHGGSVPDATKYFVEGFTETFHSLQAAMKPSLPMLIVYAHRQEESDEEGVASSTAWNAMLSAIIAAGLRIVGTWPLHATTTNRQIGQGTNSLASYMVLVCRPQEAAARPTDRQGFVAALHAELPRAVRKLQEGDIHRRSWAGGDRAGDGGVLALLPCDRALGWVHDGRFGAQPDQPGVGRGARRVRRRPRQGDPAGP